MPRIQRKGIHGFRPGNVLVYEINICSWNVLTLNQSGKLQDLRNTLQTYKADITALQEIKWIGKGELEDRSKYQCDLYYSCALRSKWEAELV